MERSRKVKFIIMITLMVAISAMSLGFAAFSATLNISSGASVTPISNDFDLVFSSDEDSVGDEGDVLFVSGVNENGATSSTAYVNGTSIYGLDVSFTAPNQRVTYSFYIHNVGEYDAYLTEIYATDPTGNGTLIWCEPVDNSENGATESLVREACNNIGVSIDIRETTYSLDQVSIYGEKLEKGTSMLVELTVYYKNGAWADGPFDVYIGDIYFNFSTVDNNSDLISFTIGGAKYQAIEGMTWREWSLSDLYAWKSYGVNVDAPVVSGSGVSVAYSDGTKVYGRDTIIANYNYIYDMGNF